MTQTAITDDEVAERTKLGAVRQGLVDLAKVVGQIFLTVLFLVLAVILYSQLTAWGNTPVGVEPFARTDTEIAVHANGCGEIRFNVKERGDEIRVSAEHQTNVVAQGCQFYTTKVIELDEPVGSRQVVSAETGEPLACITCQLGLDNLSQGG